MHFFLVTRKALRSLQCLQTRRYFYDRKILKRFDKFPFSRLQQTALPTQMQSYYMQNAAWKVKSTVSEEKKTVLQGIQIGL